MLHQYLKEKNKMTCLKIFCQPAPDPKQNSGTDGERLQQ